MEDRGPEHPTESSGNLPLSPVGAAESGAVGAVAVWDEDQQELLKSTGTDPALRLLIDVWDDLPNSVRSQILRLADDALIVQNNKV